MNKEGHDNIDCDIEKTGEIIFNPYNTENIEITLSECSIYSQDIWCKLHSR